MNRSQGTTRLAAVVNDIGPLSLTNNFFILDLYRGNMSTTTYIDKKLYGVRPDQSHSVGTSGPGGAYVAAGLMGVAAIFILYGVFYRSTYECMDGAHEDNVIGVVWSSIMSLLLIDIMSENINISNVKYIIAMGGLVFVFRKIFLVSKA